MTYKLSNEAAHKLVARMIELLKHGGWDSETELIDDSVSTWLVDAEFPKEADRAPSTPVAAQGQETINRFELIDWTKNGRHGCGRCLVIWEDPDKISIRFELQDDGRTLKVFVSDAPKDTAWQQTQGKSAAEINAGVAASEVTSKES